MIPPPNPLKEVFNADSLRRLRSYTSRSKQLDLRLKVLTASGPYPREPSSAHVLENCRALKAAWDTYIHAAYACGLMKGSDGNDRLARLRDTDDENFRSALAECQACWYFSGKLRLSVEPPPPAKGGRRPDLVVHLPSGPAFVEVKAPYKDPPTERTWCGDDADTLAGCVDEANGQFKKNGINILCIVPSLRIPVYGSRYQLLRAFIAEEKIQVPLNLNTGEMTGPARSIFSPDGKFLSLRYKSGRDTAFRRVGAVVSIEGWPVTRNTNIHPRTHIEHKVLVLHNPFAHHPIPENIWGDSPQFVQKDGTMSWTDGRGLYP